MTGVDTICVLAGAYAGEYSLTELVDWCDEVSSEVTLPSNTLTDFGSLASTTVCTEFRSFSILHDKATAVTADIFHKSML